MKCTKKQIKSKILKKFHKGSLKLSVSEISELKLLYISTGKRVNSELRSYTYGYSGIKWAMLRKFNYKPYLHMPVLNIKQQNLNKKFKELGGEK